MAALSITAANVLPGSGAVTSDGTAGGTLTAGLAVYADSADSFKLKAASKAAAASAAVAGIAIVGSSNNQRSVIQNGGTIGGMGATKGIIYCLGTAGAIIPSADLTTNDWVTVLGVGNSAGGIDLAIKVSGSQV